MTDIVDRLNQGAPGIPAMRDGAEEIMNLRAKRYALEREVAALQERADYLAGRLALYEHSEIALNPPPSDVSARCLYVNQDSGDRCARGADDGHKVHAPERGPICGTWNVPADSKAPEGWKLVPIEITPAMIEALRAMPQHIFEYEGSAGPMWRALLAAAPACTARGGVSAATNGDTP